MYLLYSSQFGLEVADGGFIAVLPVCELAVGGLQLGQASLQLVRAPLVGTLQLPPQLLILLLQTSLRLHTHTHTHTHTHAHKIDADEHTEDVEM